VTDQSGSSDIDRKLDLAKSDVAYTYSLSDRELIIYNEGNFNQACSLGRGTASKMIDYLMVSEDEDEQRNGWSEALVRIIGKTV